MDPGLTEVDLAKFTGRDITYFGDSFSVEALSQAGDLFELATRRTELPDADTLAGRTARRGVLAMAEALYEGNKSRDLRFSPMRTETIGSYTYALAEERVRAGIPTGVSWFDLAVNQLSLDAYTSVSNSSISAFDRPGDVISVGEQDILVGPADTEQFAQGRRQLGWAEGGQPL